MDGYLRVAGRCATFTGIFVLCALVHAVSKVYLNIDLQFFSGWWCCLAFMWIFPSASLMRRA